jgi:hypothetical protein
VDGMRLGIPFVIVAIFVSPLSADDATKIKAILDKAIEAQGGLEKVKQLRRIQSRSIGTVASPQGKCESTREFLLEWPEKPEHFRMKIVMEQPNGKVPVDFLVENYDQGWFISKETAIPLTPEQLYTMRQEIFAHWVATLLPLVESKFNISLLGEIKENNTILVGLKIERKSFNPIDLYFDSKTGLLSKYSFSTKEAGVPVKKDLYLSKYEKFDGLLMPTREVEYTNERKTTDWEIKEYKFPEKIDAKEFAKPKENR